MVVGEMKRTANIMDGIENTGDVRMHDHRLRLKQRFDIVRKLGQGTYGKVQLGINKKTGQEVAIKTIKKCKIESEADLIRIRREVQIMSSVRHPNIVHIYEVFENSEKMILVMEYCSGGELYDYLSQKKVLQEDEARRLFRQIATAVYYCHIHKICHRDLKLENVLLDDTGSAKIADFGLSNVFKETSLLSTFCGSPLYASPEIVKGTPYIGPEVDCWSLGVLLYTLVYGAMPFDGSNFKRLVRQISNGDYYEPRNPSTASPLIRDMLTVDPVKRADIAYICDHPWVNNGCVSSCLEDAQALAAQTPVRLDLLLSLAPPAQAALLVPGDSELGPEDAADPTATAPAPVEPSSSAEKRILELMAEGGEDAIKPSPTRTIVPAGDKRKLELAMSASGLQRKKERVASVSSLSPQAPAVPEEPASESPTAEEPTSSEQNAQPTLRSSATMTITPSPSPAPPSEITKEPTKEIVKTPPKEDENREKTGARPRVVIKKKTSPTKSVEEKTLPEKEEAKAQDESKPSAVAAAADKLTSLSLAQTTENKTPVKPKKLSIPGGNVGSFKDQFERRASLTAAPEVKRNVSKPVVSKIAKPKAQSEDRELSSKPTHDNGTVRLQQIGIEPSTSVGTEHAHHSGGVKKTESEPMQVSALDPGVLLQDARRSLQNSMAKLVEEKAGEENRRRAARDIISTAIRTGKPPVPYGRSSSAGVASLATPPPAPRLFRTEAKHTVDDHRNRGTSVERIIPIQMSSDEPATPVTPAPSTPVTTPPVATHRRAGSDTSGECVSAVSSPGEPIKKSAREFIIPIAVEGQGYVTPRRRSVEPEGGASARGAESESPLHRLRPSRLARHDSASSGEDDEEDEGFHLLTAENLFSTLLHRVRALTQRLNGEEGPGFPQHPHSLFNNLQSPFFNSPHLPRRHLLREGWGSRDLQADFDSMFSKPRQSVPRGRRKKSTKNGTNTETSEEETKDETGLDLSDLDLGSIEFSEREMRALSGLTPALSRRLQRQLLASLPAGAARTLRRTLSLHGGAPPPPRAARSHSASAGAEEHPAPDAATLPRPRRRSEPRDETPPADRPLLSKYLSAEKRESDTPEPAEPVTRPAPRLPTADYPRKRVSRFLRSDFYDPPTEESAYMRHKKEKELETQKILREIRERRARAEAAAEARDRSRSGTPYSPALHDIEESALDRDSVGFESKHKNRIEEEVLRDSRLTRPKSYPVKAPEPTDDRTSTVKSDMSAAAGTDTKEKRESKLIRPKSYPTSSPSPEKVFIRRGSRKDENRNSIQLDEVPSPETKTDVEVSFSITLPKRNKNENPLTAESTKSNETYEQNDTKQDSAKKSTTGTLVLKKYQIVNDVEQDKNEKPNNKFKNGTAIINGNVNDGLSKYNGTEEPKESQKPKAVDTNKTTDSESSEKKGTVKKKIIRKVSSKSKTDIGSGNDNSEVKTTEKKKVTKKIKEKSTEDDKPTSSITKKKSVLQTIGHKLEKFASSKSSSPEKVTDNIEAKKESVKLKRTQREQSVPVNVAPTTESNLIKRAVTLTDVAALDNQPVSNNKTTVSKVLGLFKKFEPKEKTKPIMEKSLSVDTADISVKNESFTDNISDFLDKEKPRRPTSLLLNGLGRKNKYSRTSSDSVSNVEKDEQLDLKKDNETKNPRNSLKLDFSRLPRVKKIVPTNPVIEPQIMNLSSVDDETDKKDSLVNKMFTLDNNLSNGDSISRSRSRSRSTISNEMKSDLSAEIKSTDKNPLSFTDNNTSHTLKNHDSTTPEKEDIVDRIRRKSFYSRFNEKKQRRKSSLVGPGAVEYDPLARIHAPPTDTKLVSDVSPTSPISYDLSPGLSIASDLSPSTERYRALLNDTRNNLKYDNYGLTDKIDTYRSLDRNDFRRYPGTRSYLDYDQPLSYGNHRYSRTKSLLDSCDGTEDTMLPSLRDPLKYNRTLSMYSPGNYATYRPKRTHNPAIILKESEKEPSPENILEKIRQRKKISISVTRKPDNETETSTRSPVPPKGEGDGTECAEKVD